MSDINKGVLIYNEWFEAMRALEPNEFKAIVLAIYDAQIHDVPPPEFNGVALAIASIIFPYIERRKRQAERGRASAAARFAKESERDESTPTVDSTVDSTVGNQNKNKLNKNKLTYNQIKPNQSAYPSATGSRDSAYGFAAYKKAPNQLQSFDTDDFFNAAVRRSLGDIT